MEGYTELVSGSRCRMVRGGIVCREIAHGWDGLELKALRRVHLEIVDF